MADKCQYSPFRDDGWFTDRNDPDLLIAHTTSGFHFQLTEWDELPLTGNHKFCFIASHQELVELKAQLEQQMGGEADFCFQRRIVLKFYPVVVTKGWL